MRWLLILILTLGACNPSAEATEPAAEAQGVEALDVRAFHGRWEAGEGVFLDVRTPGEYASGHVPGAYLIPVQDLSARVDEVRAWQGQTVYVYCRTSNRSGVAVDMLRDAGIEDVVQVRGGFSKWAAAGYPVER